MSEVERLVLLTDLMEELRKLHLHLLPLEHVVLRLLADGRNLVELSCHRVRFLKENVEEAGRRSGSEQHKACDAQRTLRGSD